MGRAATGDRARDLAGAIRRDITEEEERTQRTGVALLAAKSGLSMNHIYQRLELRYEVSAELLHAVLAHTEGSHTRALIASWQRETCSACPGRLARRSGELQAVLLEDLADDGVVNRPETAEAAARVAAEALAVQRVARHASMRLPKVTL